MYLFLFCCELWPGLFLDGFFELTSFFINIFIFIDCLIEWFVVFFSSLRPPMSVLLFVSFGLLWAPLFFDRSCSSADSLIHGQENYESYLPSQQCMMGGFLGITAVGRNNISEHSRWLQFSSLTADHNLRDNTHFHTNTSIDQRMSPHHNDSSA